MGRADGDQGPLLRAASSADAAGISAIYAPVVAHTAASFELIAPDASEVARRMQAGPRLPWLVADDGDRLAGFAYASPFRQRPAYRWSVETSVYVETDYIGRGLGRALMTALMDRLAAGGIVMAFAGIALPSEASVRLHESLGFRPVGVFPNVGHKHGRWHGVGWWSKQIRALEDDPPEPTGQFAAQPPGHNSRGRGTSPHQLT